MPSIRLERVAKIYKNSRLGISGTLEADLTIRQGEFVFISGVRGAGKSTLMEILALELEPDRGRVYLDDVDLGSAGARKRARLGRCVSAILQDSELRRTETVFKNLASANRLEYLKDKLINKPLIEKALALVGMPGSGERLPSELTGSECRRIELARAILRSPSILVLDGLAERADDETVWDMLHLLSELNDRGTTVIMATGESRFVNIMNKRVITLADGKIMSDVQRSKYGYLG